MTSALLIAEAATRHPVTENNADLVRCALRLARDLRAAREGGAE